MFVTVHTHERTDAALMCLNKRFKEATCASVMKRARVKVEEEDGGLAALWVG